MSDRDSYKVPAFCPICERMMTGVKSIGTYYDHGCCVDCFIEWVEDRTDRWKAGWRPSGEQVAAFQDMLKRPRYES